MNLAAIIQIILSLSPIARYAILFGLIVIEGPLVTMGAGLLSNTGILNFTIAYFVIIFAEVFGDFLYYGFGWWGGSKLETTSKKFAKMSPRRLENLKRMFQDHPKKTIVLGKLTHVVGVPVLLMSGISRIKPRTFLIYDSIATLPKSLIFLIIGYYAGHAAEQFNTYLTDGTLLISGFMVAAVIGYILVGSYLDRKLE